MRGSSNPVAEFPERAGPPPVVADRVAILAVPLGPPRREVPCLVAARTAVPRFGDKFHLADHGILLNQVAERGQPVDVIELTGQRGGPVETETIDMHLELRVPQRIRDELKGVRVAHVE
jgi:hypothetical protein